MALQRFQTLLSALLFAALLTGCDEKVVQSTGSKPGADKQAAPVAKAPAAKPQKVEFQEADFAETERSRDPFRAFGSLLIEETNTRIKSQRDVVLNEFAIDELKLAGIVTRVEPRAMLVDPTGKGHVVRRGQFVGRPEMVQVGAQGTGYEINWRVDRIRPADIVLVRADPKNPDLPTATKVIPLRPEGSLVESK